MLLSQQNIKILKAQFNRLGTESVGRTKVSSAVFVFQHGGNLQTPVKSKLQTKKSM